MCDSLFEGMYPSALHLLCCCGGGAGGRLPLSPLLLGIFGLLSDAGSAAFFSLPGQLLLIWVAFRDGMAAQHPVFGEPPVDVIDAIRCIFFDFCPATLAAVFVAVTWTTLAPAALPMTAGKLGVFR